MGTTQGKDFLGCHRLLETSGSLLHHRPNMMKPNAGHNRNCTLFAFNIVPNGNADAPFHRNPKQEGNLRLEIDFSANPGKNITVLVFG